MRHAAIMLSALLLIACENSPQPTAAEPPTPTELAASQPSDWTPPLREKLDAQCLVLDGVYVRVGDGELRFHALPKPTPEEVAAIARWTHDAIARVLARCPAADPSAMRLAGRRARQARGGAMLRILRPRIG
jgi:hypothetical protein